MEHIAIEIATYDGTKKDFVYGIQHRFPFTAKGLALAVIAAERMMKIDAHHYAYADIGIKFMADEKSGKLLEGRKFFELIGRHRAGLSIIDDCLSLIVEGPEAAANRAA